VERLDFEEMRSGLLTVNLRSNEIETERKRLENTDEKYFGIYFQKCLAQGAAPRFQNVFLSEQFEDERNLSVDRRFDGRRPRQG
jgi:hypothetical protein